MMRTRTGRVVSCLLLLFFRGVACQPGKGFGAPALLNPCPEGPVFMSARNVPWGFICPVWIASINENILLAGNWPADWRTRAEPLDFFLAPGQAFARASRDDIHRAASLVLFHPSDLVDWAARCTFHDAMPLGLQIAPLQELASVSLHINDPIPNEMKLELACRQGPMDQFRPPDMTNWFTPAAIIIVSLCCLGVLFRHRRGTRRRRQEDPLGAAPLSHTMDIVSEEDSLAKEASEKAITRQLAQLPVYTWHQLDPEARERLSSCALCMEQFEMRDALRVLPCTHHFHVHCIDPWFSSLKFRTRACPLCKSVALNAHQLNARPATVFARSPDSDLVVVERL